jgi:hypothetical protein
MALDDATFGNNMNAAIAVIHNGTAGRDALGSAIKTYAAGANLTIPGAGLTAPAGAVGGSVSPALTFTGATLDGGLATLFGSNHTRNQARDLLVSAIQAYAATAIASVPAAGFTTGAGPLVGMGATGTPTFADAALASAIAAVYAQDNSAAFASSALTAAIKTYFKSGRLPVPASGFTGPIPAGGFAPAGGTATGAVT